MREKREKAINFFQDMQECTYGNLEEIDMAIHALEQERNVIEELEKIKAEFEDKILLNQTVAIQIIDNHIAELKGENKKECSTCKSDNSLENCLGCIEYGHWELKGENNAEKSEM